MDILENLKESDIAIVVAQVERFERLCSEERSFGVEVETAIQDIDELARRDVTHAEAELEVCRMECEPLRNRLQRAREGRCPFYHIWDQPLNLEYALLQGKKSSPTLLTQRRFLLLTGLR